jgi:transcriptional regulator with XRE-family HTH domain
VKLKISKEKKQKVYEEIESGNLALGLALKSLRRSIGKSQSEYAKLAGVTIRIIRDFEQNRANPTLSTINKMFKPFGLEVYLKRTRR